MAHVFTDADFNEEVLKAGGLVLVDFYATWCGPCKMMAPIFDALATEMPEVKMGKLDVDASPQTAGQYGVSSIPTTIFFKDGKEVARLVGFQSKDALTTAIEKNK